MPGTFRVAVAAEMGQAFSPRYQVPIVVAVNGLLMATKVLAPDRIRVLAALGDGTMISRLLLAKTAVLWVFVAPLCAVLALVVAVEHHHALQVHYRWDHRVPLRRMMVRWLILAAVPYALVPALCLLMTVPAVILLVLTHSASNHVIGFVDAEGKPFGLALSAPATRYRAACLPRASR